MENEIAKRILSGDFTESDTVLVDVAKGKLTFARQAPAKTKAPAGV